MVCSTTHTLPCDEPGYATAECIVHSPVTNLNDFNKTGRDYNLEIPVYRYFEEQAEKKPLQPAVLLEGREMSYSDLNRSANALAHYLFEQGVHSNDVVAVVMDRSFDMVISLTGILKCGGAYLPVDPSLPVERIEYMLGNAGVKTVLVHKEFYLLLPESDLRCIRYDQENDLIGSGFSSDNFSHTPAKEDLAYVMYTSGSTGKPKACMLPHQALCNRLLWMQELYPLKDEDRVLQKTPFSFDVSVWEFFWPLMTGASIVMAKPKGHKSPKYIAETIIEYKVTVCHFVPAMFNVFLREPRAVLCKSLRYVFASGEPLPYGLVHIFLDHFNCRLINLYGPTEATIDVTYWECEKSRDKKVFIGKPISNTCICILGPDLQPVEVGQKGEIYIGGVGVAYGYMNNTQLTAQRFVPNPFHHMRFPVLYKTGDGGRYSSNGNIEYLGRLDYQVKLRGLRIELGEIESVLMEIPPIKEAIVALQDVNSNSPRLVAYITADSEITTLEIKRYLSRKLPEYSVPQFYVYLEAFPVSAHGKLDRNALPWPVSTPTSYGLPFSGYLSARNSLECD